MCTNIIITVKELTLTLTSAVCLKLARLSLLILPLATATLHSIYHR